VEELKNKKMIRGFQDSQFMMSSNNADAVTDLLYADWMPADGTPVAAGLPAPGSTPTQVANDPGYLSVQNDGSVVDAQGNVTTPAPTTVDKVKANILKTDASDEGYVVDPLRKKFEPYIIGGLVAVGVLFLFGMVKVGSETQQVQTVQAK
tara:strand:+ start:450 stop:899 length:450 start_codon:yes stop_codon:yes gene_type:complete